MSDDMAKQWRFLVGAKNTIVGTYMFGSFLNSLGKEPPEYQDPPLENTHPMEGMADAKELEQ